MLNLRKQGYKLSYIDVNLSSLQCLQKNIADRMLTAIQRYGLDPADIRFEITETAAAQSPFLMKNNLASLSEAGFILAIDDFGTGHSNLYMLMGIPFSVVKLDRSLLLAMNESIQGRIGMESISGMFKKMGIPLVAEGVETAAELEEMRKLKIDLIQGYYFSKPLSKADFLNYAKERTV